MKRGPKEFAERMADLRQALAVMHDPLALEALAFARRPFIKEIARKEYAKHWAPVGRAASNWLVTSLAATGEEYHGTPVGILADALAAGQTQVVAAELMGGLSPIHVSRHVKPKLMAILLMKAKRLDQDATGRLQADV